MNSLANVFEDCSPTVRQSTENSPLAKLNSAKSIKQFKEVAEKILTEHPQRMSLVVLAIGNFPGKKGQRKLRKFFENIQSQFNGNRSSKDIREIIKQAFAKSN